MRGADVASWVRGRALLRRRLGRASMTELASRPTLDAALAQLASSPYGREVRTGMSLEEAQTAVQSVLLWHMRVLAGWESPLRASPIRPLAGGFEIRNVIAHLGALAGGSRRPPYDLGSLSTAWPAVRSEVTATAVRAALARTEWGDPGGEDPGTVLLAMRIAWARRVFDQVPEAASWARAAAAILWDDIVAAGSEAVVKGESRRRLESVLGPRISHPPVPSGERWTYELRWWGDVERSSRALVSAGVPGTASTVGVVGLLAADAWRANAALALVSRGARDEDLESLLDAVG